MLPNLRTALKAIGLSEKEMRVLSVLLETGPMFASAIAKAAKLNRTTTYGLLKDLSEKGLASTIDKKGTIRFQSIAPELLPAYIERRQNELEESKQQVKDMLPQLALLRNRSQALPKVQFFEGKKGIEQAYEDTLVNNKSGVLHEVTGIDGVYTHLDPAFVKYYTEKRTRLGIHSTYITPDSVIARAQKADDKKLLRSAKFIPAEFAFNSEIAVYDNKVGMFSYALENPVAILIEDETIAKTMRTIFDFMEKHST